MGANSKRIKIVGIVAVSLIVAIGITAIVVQPWKGEAHAQQLESSFEFPPEGKVYESMAFNPVIYFSRDFIEPDDRWVWTAFPCTSVADGVEGYPYIEDDGTPNYEDTVRFFAKEWRPVLEWAWDDVNVNTIVGDELGLGFRLPDDTSDAELEAFAIELDEFLWNNKPCEL